jgi:hypothetical protein
MPVGRHRATGGLVVGWRCSLAGTGTGTGSPSSATAWPHPAEQRPLTLHSPCLLPDRGDGLQAAAGRMGDAATDESSEACISP